MGKAAKEVKDRKCNHCERIFHWAAATLKAHAELCKRAKAIGLELSESREQGRAN